MKEPKVVAIVQARMASSRLPGKVLANLGGKPMLAWVARRARRAKHVDDLVIATTTGAEDDAVVEFCKKNDLACYRGSMYDVLDRVYQAAKDAEADVVVRITGDCPFIDPGLIDALLEEFLAADPPLDFAANRLPGDRTLPIGLDAEVCTFDALEIAWREAQQSHQREHVMPYFYENPESFKIMHLRNEADWGHLRWTVDTQQDLDLAREIVSEFDGDDFSWQKILELFERRPKLAEINADVAHKGQFDVDDRQ